MISKLFLKGIFVAFLIMSFVPKVHAQWYTKRDKDEMTGEQSNYAHSPSTTATEPMDFPYGGTKAWFGVGCSGPNEWVYIGFSNEPNLNNTTTEDGYNRINTRIKFDDKIKNVTLTQEWGDKFLNFTYGSEIIPKLIKSNTVLLELDWHGEGSTYFRFSLDGSAKAIEKIRQRCSN